MLYLSNVYIVLSFAILNLLSWFTSSLIQQAIIFKSFLALTAYIVLLCCLVSHRQQHKAIYYRT